jgi:hypothetical protein
VSASENEDAIEAVAADGPHPALSERVRVRRLHRSPDHLDLLRAEDFVEGAAELRVAVMDQQLEAAWTCWERPVEATGSLRNGRSLPPAPAKGNRGARRGAP